MVITGPDNIGFQSNNDLGQRLIWLAGGALVGLKLYRLWLDYPHANRLGLVIMGLMAAFGLACVLQAMLGMQKTVYFDLTGRTIDIFHSVLGKSFGRTLDFDQIYRIHIVEIPPSRYQARHWNLHVDLKGRSGSIIRERFYSQQAAADVAGKLHEGIFGDGPEPWALEGLVSREQSLPA